MTAHASSQGLTEQLTTAVLVLDSQLQICYFNTASCAVLGLGEKRLAQHYFPALFQHLDLKASHLTMLYCTANPLVLAMCRR